MFRDACARKQKKRKEKKIEDLEEVLRDVCARERTNYLLQAEELNVVRDH